jgi:hypothetical protein
MFILGINIGLRASDLVKLEITDMKSYRGHFWLEFKEAKKKKAAPKHKLTINKDAVKAFR